MIKKTITSGLVLVWISSVALAGYRYLEPKAAETIIENKTAVALVDVKGKSIEDTDASVASLSIDEEENKSYHYYYFCSIDNDDCIYINDYVLKPLSTTLNVDTIDIIEYVDLSTLSSEWTPQRLKNQWGFDDFPAFVAISKDTDGNQEILSVLQWSADNPIDEDSLKNWMIENNIWNGPIEEQGIPIEQPAE